MCQLKTPFPASISFSKLKLANSLIFGLKVMFLAGDAILLLPCVEGSTESSSGLQSCSKTVRNVSDMCSAPLSAENGQVGAITITLLLLTPHTAGSQRVKEPKGQEPKGQRKPPCVNSSLVAANGDGDVVPLLSIVVNCCQLLSIVVHCCPLLSFVVHCCLLLSLVVNCCPLLSSLLCYPLLSIVIHCCSLLSIVVHCYPV